MTSSGLVDKDAQRHVTRQKILNWKQSLRFPARPRVSHEGIELMRQLLCEPEDRLGSQASSSVSRPNSMVVQARRSGFAMPMGGGPPDNDGAAYIKVCAQIYPVPSLDRGHLVDAPCVPRRRIPGLKASIGRISTDTLRPTARSLSVLRTRAISTQIFQQRYVSAYVIFWEISAEQQTFVSATRSCKRCLSRRDARSSPWPQRAWRGDYGCAEGTCVRGLYS